MKKIYTILSAFLVMASTYAQAPEKVSYQAVIRNSSGVLVANQNIGIQISILQGSSTGTASYIETHKPTSNANGLVSLEIGTGTIVTGTFAGMDWANGPFFIKLETDPAGGTSYTISGTSQLLSVPYALHATTADSLTGGITETDPVFGSSIASGITAKDTANWNKHAIDTDTQLDSLGIASFGFVAGSHTINTDTQLDSMGVAALGFVAGSHTVDTDTQLDSLGIASLGYVAGPHTVELDGDTSNELQTITRSGDTITLSNNGGTIIDSVNNYAAGKNIQIDGLTISSIDPFYLGQDTLGGIVYYIYKDAKGDQHGLIVAKSVSSGPWQSTPKETVTGAASTWDGPGNTAKMTNSPIRTYVTSLGKGWYIPSVDELSLMWHTRYTTNKALSSGKHTIIGARVDYWASTELDRYKAYSHNFASGAIEWGWAKYQTLSVRAIRAF